MSMCDTARKLLAQVCADLSAAKARRDDLEMALVLLAKAGISEGIIEDLKPELEQAREEARELLIQRFLLRAGMRAHGWLADGE